MIVFAVNVHTGGGKVLLDTLLTEQPFGPISAAFLDSRYQAPESAQNIPTFRFRPKIWDRVKAQMELKKYAQANNRSDSILFFGNYPPFFKFTSKAIVYLQNCFLLSSVPLPRDSIFEMVRNGVERFLLKFFRRNIDEIWIQTNWMMDLCRKDFPDLNVFKKPFLPKLPMPNQNIRKKYHFICVASESAHKNIDPLIRALTYMDTVLSPTSQETPHFLFILPSMHKKEIQSFTAAPHKSIRVSYRVAPKREELFELYQESLNIIVPSEYESYCLPLYEGHHFGLGVAAHNRPFFLESGLLKSVFNVHDFNETSNALIKLFHESKTFVG